MIAVLIVPIPSSKDTPVGAGGQTLAGRAGAARTEEKKIKKSKGKRQKSKGKNV
jgi:hypothetical protein